MGWLGATSVRLPVRVACYRRSRHRHLSLGTDGGKSGEPWQPAVQRRGWYLAAKVQNLLKSAIAANSFQDHSELRNSLFIRTISQKITGLFLKYAWLFPSQSPELEPKTCGFIVQIGMGIKFQSCKHVNIFSAKFLLWRYWCYFATCNCLMGCGWNESHMSVFFCKAYGRWLSAISGIPGWVWTSPGMGKGVRQSSVSGRSCSTCCWFIRCDR